MIHGSRAFFGHTSSDVRFDTRHPQPLASNGDIGIQAAKAHDRDVYFGMADVAFGT
jgi:hypothetical protein